jgi:hypothetical protein
MTSGAPQEKPAKVAKRAAAGPGAARGAGAAGAPQLVDDAELPPRAPLVRRLTPPAHSGMPAARRPPPPCQARMLQDPANAVCRVQPQASCRSEAAPGSLPAAPTSPGRAQGGKALRVHRSNTLGRRARGPAWPPEVGDADPLPAGCCAGDLLEVLEFLEARPRASCGKWCCQAAARSAAVQLSREVTALCFPAQPAGSRRRRCLGASWA